MPCYIATRLVLFCRSHLYSQSTLTKNNNHDSTGWRLITIALFRKCVYFLSSGEKGWGCWKTSTKQSFYWAHHGARQKNRWDFETIAVIVVVIMELNFVRSIFSSLILLAKPKIPPIQLTNFHWWSGGSVQWIKSTKFELNSDTNDDGKK